MEPIVRIRVLLCRLRRGLRRFASAVLEVALRPMYPETIVGWILSAVSGLCLSAAGIMPPTDDFFQSYAGSTTVQWGVLVWVCYSLLYGIFRVFFPKDPRGTWSKELPNRFVFVEPLVVKVFTATSDQNGQLKKFRVPFAPAGAVCELITEPADSMAQRVQVHSKHIHNALWTNNPPPSVPRGDAVLLDSKREACISWQLPPDSLPVSVRVRLNWFEFQHPSVGDPPNRYDARFTVSETDCYLSRPEPLNKPISAKLNSILKFILPNKSSD